MNVWNKYYHFLWNTSVLGRRMNSLDVPFWRWRCFRKFCEKTHRECSWHLKTSVGYVPGCMREPTTTHNIEVNSSELLIPNVWGSHRAPNKMMALTVKMKVSRRIIEKFCGAPTPFPCFFRSKIFLTPNPEPNPEQAWTKIRVRRAVNSRT